MSDQDAADQRAREAAEKTLFDLGIKQVSFIPTPGGANASAARSSATSTSTTSCRRASPSSRRQPRSTLRGRLGRGSGAGPGSSSSTARWLLLREWVRRGVTGEGSGEGEAVEMQRASAAKRRSCAACGRGWMLRCSAVTMREWQRPRAVSCSYPRPWQRVSRTSSLPYTVPVRDMPMSIYPALPEPR